MTTELGNPMLGDEPVNPVIADDKDTLSGGNMAENQGGVNSFAEHFTHNTDDNQQDMMDQNNENPIATLKDRIDFLEQEVGIIPELRQDLNSSRQELDNVRRQKETELNQAIDNLRRQHASERGEMEQKLQQYSQMVQSVQSGDYVPKAEVEKMKNELRNQLSDLDSSLESKIESEEENNNLRQLLDTTQHDKAALQTRLDNLRQQVKGALLELRSEVLALQIVIDRGEERVLRLDSDVKRLSNQATTAQTMYTDQKKEFKDMQRDHTSNQKQLQKLRQKVGNLNSQISSHRQAVDKLKSEMEAKIHTAETERDSRDQQIQKLKKNIEQQQTKFTDLKNKQKDLEAEKNRFVVDKRAEIEKKMVRQEQAQIILEKDLSQAQSDLKNRSTENSKLRNDLKHSQSQLEKEKSSAAQANTQCETWQKKARTAIDKSKNANESHRNISSQLESLHAKISSLTEQNSSLHESLRKKAEKEKHFKERERQIATREKQLQMTSKEDKHRRRDRSDKQRPNRNVAPEVRPTNAPWYAAADPLFKFKSLIPWHWLCIVLVILIFIDKLLN